MWGITHSYTTYYEMHPNDIDTLRVKYDLLYSAHMLNEVFICEVILS